MSGFAFYLDLLKQLLTNFTLNVRLALKLNTTHFHNTVIPLLEKWLSSFIHDCLDFQRNKHFKMKIHTAPSKSFSEHAPSFNYRISMATKGPITPSSQNKSYIHVIVDAFSHFVVTVPIKSSNAKIAVKTLLHPWIVKFGSLIYHVTDRGSEYFNTDMAHLCTLMGVRYSPRTPYSPWTDGRVEFQNKNLGTHIRMFSQTLPRIGHIKFICTLLHITHNPFQHSMFHHMN